MKEKFWCTPDDVYKKLNDEFQFDLDVCPFPKPDGFDSLNMEWAASNFCNPPFRKEDGGGFGPTAWVRKAIEESKKGKRSIIIIPVQSYVNLLLEAGAELRSMGRIKWIDRETGKICKSPSPICCFILNPIKTPMTLPIQVLEAEIQKNLVAINDMQKAYEAPEMCSEIMFADEAIEEFKHNIQSLQQAIDKLNKK